ncbi:hypothetical protein [Chitinophaga pinensis]|uniref:hypothetical protein n=1 Tax=Chitinophaga pinensis TaxID=79329 RepID=UPI000302E370|nr:hypothetical protein [Chitinophaga pinensis]
MLLAAAKLTPEYVTGINTIERTNWRMFIRFIGWKGSALTKNQVLYCYQVLKTFENACSRISVNIMNKSS